MKKFFVALGLMLVLILSFSNIANAQASPGAYPASYPTSYPSSYPVALPTVIITELYPAPDTAKGEEEWIEIYNYGDLDLRLKGLYFKERASGGTGYASTVSNLPDDVIKSKGYYLIKGSLLKVSLNNSGDEITLFDSAGQIVDVVRFDSVATGISYSRVFDSVNSVYTTEFKQNEILTPLEQNRFPVPAEVVYLDIASAKSSPAGTEVHTIGTVTVQKDLLGDTQFYIQDSTGGIKVDLYSSVEFTPRLWEKLKLFGEISESSGEKKLNIKRVEDVTPSGSSAPFSPLILNSQSNLDSLLGQFVIIDGTITNNYSTSFDVNSNAGLLRVSVLSSTGIDLPAKAKDDIVNIKGILTKLDGVFKILPRYQNDLNINHVVEDLEEELVESKESKTQKVLSSSTQSMPAPISYPKPTLTLPSTAIYKLPVIQDDSLTIELWPFFVLALMLEGLYVLWKERVPLKENLEVLYTKLVSKVKESEYLNFLK